MPTASLSDLELYYEVHGEGFPLLFVPGLGGTGNYWTPQIPVFSQHFQVIVHDHRGTGESTRSEIDYSVDQMSGDLLRFMDQLGIEKAHLVGHSTGGAIGQTIAIDYPDRLADLVLYATWTRADPFMRRIFLARKTLALSAGVEAYIRATPIFLFPNWWINENAAAFAAADEALQQGFPSKTITASRCDAVVNFDRSEQLDRIKARTLVICAEDDFLTPSYFSRTLAERIGGAELVILDRGGHCVSQTVPDAFNNSVLSFLKTD